ncbi:hypothetical protein ACOBV9_23190 (plasmid) [Pseudoalteromonas espejiana]
MTEETTQQQSDSQGWAQLLKSAQSKQMWSLESLTGLAVKLLPAAASALKVMNTKA